MLCRLGNQGWHHQWHYTDSTYASYVMRILFHLCESLSPNPSPQSSHGKNIRQWRNILPNTWPVLLKTAKVMGNKNEKCNKPEETDNKAWCLNAMWYPWMDSWDRQRILVEKLVESRSSGVYFIVMYQSVLVSRFWHHGNGRCSC